MVYTQFRSEMEKRLSIALVTITYIDGRPKDYRLTATASVERSSAHEHADYFRDRRGLHLGGAIMARHGVAAS
jgi:hypothetical protein